MKNTKEITTGAMLLAIFGAVLLIDRQLSFLFTEILVLAAPVLIIVFGNIYNYKDGIIFSIALLIISFILSPSVYSYFYITLGSILGNIYNFLLYKGIKSSSLLFCTVIMFIIIDICYAFIISPIFLNETFDQELVLIGESFKEFFPEEVLASLNTAGLSIDELIKVISLVSFILVGLMEGVIVHIVSIIILKRFNINFKANVGHLFTLKPVTSYILFILSALMLATPYIKNTMLASICVGVGAICLFILAYYGYIYLLMFFRVRYRKNYSLFIILGVFLLFPLSIYVLMIIGFLYGSGPLKKYLQVERKQDE